MRKLRIIITLYIPGKEGFQFIQVPSKFVAVQVLKSEHWTRGNILKVGE